MKRASGERSFFHHPLFVLRFSLTSSFRRQHPPFVQFSIIPVRSFFLLLCFPPRALAQILEEAPLSRIPWEISAHGSFGKSLLTDPLGNRFPRILWQIPSHAPFGTLLPLRSRSAFPPFSLSPLGLAKRVADVRSPERACRSEPELVSEAAKRAGASLGGRSTTTYRTIDARLPSDCEQPLFINSHPFLLSFFPKNAS